MDNTVRTRIAPSPTGMPHIGTLFQALFDYVYAKKHQGQFLVRIEDTDRNRFVEGAEEAIFKSLNWLGLIPDESPLHGGKFGPYRQSERLDIYKQHAQQLIDNDQAYYCFCSPERLTEVRNLMQKEGKPPMYDQHCRNLDKNEARKRSQSEAHVVRMKIPANQTITFKDEIRGDISFESNTVDDQVIIKSDGYPTYHLAVVVDDHLMEISHIVRGEEWITSTPKHVLLYQYLGWEIPKIIHTPDLRNPDRSKLSKRHGHAAFSWYVENGYLKEAIINFLSSRVWNHPEGLEIYPIEELIKHFDFNKMHIQGPIADLKKLDWINGQWIRSKTDQDLIKDLTPFIPENLSPELLVKVLPLIKERLEKLADLPQLTHYFHTSPTVNLTELLKESKLDKEGTKAYLQKVINFCQSIDNWDAQNLDAVFHTFQAEVGLKPRPAFMTIRIAITGESATPPLFDVMEVLGKDEVIKRLIATTTQLDQ